MKAERANRIFVLYMLITDIVMAAAAFALAYLLRVLIPFPDPAKGMRPFNEYVPMLFIHVISIVTVFLFGKLYSLHRVSRVDEFYAIIGAAVVGTLMGVAVASLTLRNFTVGQDYSRVMVGYAWLLSTLLLTVGRLFNSWLRQYLIRHGWGRRRVLIVGTGDIARMILQKILWTPHLGYDVAGVVSFQETDQTMLLQVPIVGSAANLAQIIDTYAADEVILALPEETSHHDILWLISECERGRVTIRVYPDLFQIMAGPVSIGEMGGIPILTVRDIALTGWRRSAKRLMDIVGATVGLIFLSPLMLFVAILIKLESPGPVFFVQERMGLDAKPFPILKFRSMRADAEKFGTWTAENDPRRTKIGALLRKLNIDELPQFINILLGHMSLVGPRPEQPFYVEQFRRSIPRYMDRHREKAGLTGWAQVNGYRQDTSIIERTKYDLWYIENWSLLLDIKIIIRTILQIFHSPNAY
ncbi:MAG TPA: undecaprenyl-phosphate glucose phosphotransferase [Anaerolineae bacterium]|nr:undecaprenyl-phosphate glucose phosphotransferase [Anaerolineae bacterium]HQK14082.1 undecaprenyl-phosphate glucose phosphotransferase [Anaerolineae bacterium]